jgi:hypothetical protein
VGEVEIADFDQWFVTVHRRFLTGVPVDGLCLGHCGCEREGRQAATGSDG